MRISDWSSDVCSSDLLDRKDFLHETARTWAGVGWVAGGFWLDFDEMKARFGKGLDDDTLRMAKYTARREVGEDGERSEERRGGTGCVSKCRSGGSPYH